MKSKRIVAFIDAFTAVNFEKSPINILMLRKSQPLINNAAYIRYMKISVETNQYNAHQFCKDVPGELINLFHSRR